MPSCYSRRDFLIHARSRFHCFARGARQTSKFFPIPSCASSPSAIQRPPPPSPRCALNDLPSYARMTQRRFKLSRAADSFWELWRRQWRPRRSITHGSDDSAERSPLFGSRRWKSAFRAVSFSSVFLPLVTQFVKGRTVCSTLRARQRIPFPMKRSIDAGTRCYVRLHSKGGRWRSPLTSLLFRDGGFWFK